MIRESVLKDFSNWDSEKQLSEYQAYKKLGDYSPFSEIDYRLMEMIMNNPNVEIECENGICEIIRDENDERLDESLKPTPDSIEKFKMVLSMIFDMDNEYPDVDYLNLSDDILNTIKKMSRAKTNDDDVDLLFDKGLVQESNKKNSVIYAMKQELDGSILKISKNPDLIALVDKLDTRKINIKELLDYPIFRIMLQACNKAVNYNKNMIESIYKDKEHAIFVYNNIKKVGRFFNELKKQAHLLFLRLQKQDDAASFNKNKLAREKNLKKLKDIRDDLQKEIQEIKDDIKVAEKSGSEDEVTKLKSSLTTKIGHLQDVSSDYALSKSALTGIEETEIDMYEKNKSNNGTKPDSEDSSSSSGNTQASDLYKNLAKLNKAKNDRVDEDIEQIQKYFKGKTVEQSIDDLNKLLSVKLVSSGKIVQILDEVDVLGLKLAKETIDLLHKSYDSEGKGYGKGELFFHYTMGSEIQGGGESFDVKLPTGKYEVKSYDLKNDKMESSGIRLGSYGNMNNFDEFNQLSSLLKNIKVVFKDGYGILNSMYKASATKDFKDLIKSKSKGMGLIDVLRSGEITPTNIEEVSNSIRDTKKLLDTAMDSIEANDYKMLELFGEGISDVKYILDEDEIPIPKENGDKMTLTMNVKEIDDETKYKFINNVRELRKLEAWTTPNYVFNALKNINRELMNIMKDHKLILLANKGQREIHGVYDQFVISKITQGVVRIIPSGLEPDLITKMYAKLT